MTWRFSLVVLAWLASSSAVQAVDTVSCDGKRAWQRGIVREAVHRWFHNDPRPDALVELVQAEHGIVACSSGGTAPLRLHTTTLPRGLEVDQLGAVLLANELEWSGLVSRPEDGLAGEFFRVSGVPTPNDGADLPHVAGGR